MSRPEPGETAAERDDYDLGRHIRQARVQQELTLDSLAVATGLSRSYLSNVERNVNSPTIGTLRTILDALGVSLSELFRNVEQERQRHTKVSERIQIARTGNDAIRYELVNPRPTGRIEMLIMTVAPGASSGDLPHTHAGEEVGLMLTGRLEYWVEDDHYILEAGDSLAFESTLPHRYANTGDEPAVSVWAITPPSF